MISEIMQSQSAQQENASKENIVIHYSLSFKRVCLLTVSCPFVALIICFVTAYIFQGNDIHETYCRVYNIIPSISSVTGISPQRYLWRISVAFHIGPRIIISAVHQAYHLNLINPQSERETRLKAEFWLKAAFWLNIIETGAVCGVTYISNRENYPVHEKLFMTFIVSSLTHMLACIKGLRAVAQSRGDMNLFGKRILIKKVLLEISVICTVGLVGFFLQHRHFCHNLAFSMFALCEYILALANMAFHITVILDFPTEHFIIAKGIPLNGDPKFTKVE